VPPKPVIVWVPFSRTRQGGVPLRTPDFRSVPTAPVSRGKSRIRFCTVTWTTGWFRGRTDWQVGLPPPKESRIRSHSWVAIGRSAGRSGRAVRVVRDRIRLAETPRMAGRCRDDQKGYALQCRPAMMRSFVTAKKAGDTVAAGITHPGANRLLQNCLVDAQTLQTAVALEHPIISRR
jgi:hypothetical protein